MAGRLTAFLTPDGKPFYGGTYFPPDENYGRPSFKRVLNSIADAYHQKNGDVMEQAEMVEVALSRAESFAGSRGEFSPKVIDEIVESAVKMFDPQNGGFGSAPKFPHPAVLDLLIDQYARSGDEKLRDIFVPTLEKMAHGGVYDQLAGGFHRYSVDERWIVPHFEKMCYDNSELLKNYVHAYQVTGSEFFAAVARDIVRWMDEWLSDRESGGFYASQDADYSMDDDGDYFTWTRAEMLAVLSEEEAGSCRLALRRQRSRRDAPQSGKECSVRPGFAGGNRQAAGLTVERVYARCWIRRSRKCMLPGCSVPRLMLTRLSMWAGTALCVSAYLEAARVLKAGAGPPLCAALAGSRPRRGLAAGAGIAACRRILRPGRGTASRCGPAGRLRFHRRACLDAYEATADLSYFNFATAHCGQDGRPHVRSRVGRVLRYASRRGRKAAWAC